MGINCNSTIVITDALYGYFDNISYRGQVLQMSPTQGFSYGYYNYYGPASTQSTARFPFTNSIVLNKVGDLNINRLQITMTGSKTYGYSLGGSTPVTPPAPGTPLTLSNQIERFPFAIAIVNGADVGDLTVARMGAGTVASDSYGYACGGKIDDLTGDPTPTAVNTIDRFPFALSITNAADVGDTVSPNIGYGSSSATYGYIVNPWYSPPADHIINRFPFALSITNAAVVGDLSAYVDGGMVLNSAEYGYVAGGAWWGPPYTGYTKIDRFAFAASITNAADIGDLTMVTTFGINNSSDSYGYVGVGGAPTYPGGWWQSACNRFPFASGAINGELIGDGWYNASSQGANY